MYQEAEAVKRRKRYARPLVDKHMDVYRKEGLKPWSPENLPLPSGMYSHEPSMDKFEICRIMTIQVLKVYTTNPW